MKNTFQYILIALLFLAFQKSAMAAKVFTPFSQTSIQHSSKNLDAPITSSTQKLDVTSLNQFSQPEESIGDFLLEKIELKEKNETDEEQKTNKVSGLCCCQSHFNVSLAEFTEKSEVCHYTTTYLSSKEDELFILFGVFLI